MNLTERSNIKTKGGSRVLAKSIEQYETTGIFRTDWRRRRGKTIHLARTSDLYFYDQRFEKEKTQVECAYSSTKNT